MFILIIWENNVILMFLSVINNQRDLFLNYLMRLQRLLITSGIFAKVIRELEKVVNHFIIKDLLSTELLPTSWLKEVTSLDRMELVVNLFMEKNSRMKTSSKNTTNQDFCQWLMLDQTPTVLNFS